MPANAMPFCYECIHCKKTFHEIWLEEGNGYAEAVREGRYPKESPVPLKRLTEADLAEMERKQAELLNQAIKELEERRNRS